jgi:hypothetical protein
MVVRTQALETAEPPEDTELVEAMRNQGNSIAIDSCIVTSEKLLGILKAEGEALKTFQKERLLVILAEKEASAKDLAHKMKMFESSKAFVTGTGQERSLIPDAAGDTEEVTEDERAKRGFLRGLIGEIVACNQRNHIFVQGSLDHCQGLLNLCLPSTYVPGHGRQATRQPVLAKGLALNREI